MKWCPRCQEWVNTRNNDVPSFNPETHNLEIFTNTKCQKCLLTLHSTVKVIKTDEL